VPCTNPPLLPPHRRICQGVNKGRERKLEGGTEMLERSKDEEEEVEKYSILSQVGKPS
jgi:hypothetical protein